MLGDNRDNSADSRYIGFVPRRLLIGQAVRVLVSADILDWWQPRWSRFGRTLGAGDDPDQRIRFSATPQQRAALDHARLPGTVRQRTRTRAAQPHH